MCICACVCVHVYMYIIMYNICAYVCVYVYIIMYNVCAYMHVCEHAPLTAEVMWVLLLLLGMWDPENNSLMVDGYEVQFNKLCNSHCW